MRILTHAEELLQEFYIEKPEEIDLEGIASYCGADIREEKLDNCEAQIIGVGDRAQIIVNVRSSYERRRFSIGHELGHWRYHYGQSFICRAKDIGEDKVKSLTDPEKVADGYAVDLLLPQFIFEPLAGQYEHASFQAVLELKERFSTSITATALRFVDFCPETCMLICHDRAARKWFKHGKHVPPQLFPRNKIDEDSFAFDVLIGKSDKSGLRKIPAEAWFEVNSREDYEVYEDTIQIDNGKVLTLISWRDEDMLEKYS